MTATMQASVLVDVGRLELMDVPRPVPASDELLLSVCAVGVCGTDFHIFSGESNYNLDGEGRPIPLAVEPQILGHEIVGQVAEVGDAVHGFTAGERVVIDQGLSCTPQGIQPACEYCTSGSSHQCENYRELGITGLPGGFAEALAVPAACAVRVRGELDPARAAMTEPLACVLHALDVTRRASSRYALAADQAERRVRSVLLLGAGPAGLLLVQVLRAHLGFDGPLLVHEPDSQRRELAQRFGAEVIDAGGPLLAEVVSERTQGRGVELLIESSGSSAAFALIPTLIRKQATVVGYGIGYGGGGLDCLNLLHWKEPTFLLPVGASGHFPHGGAPQVYRDALAMIEQGTVDVGPIVSHRYAGLRDLPSAFHQDHRRPGYVKGVAVL